jgi:hypothetical protein
MFLRLTPVIENAGHYGQSFPRRNCKSAIALATGRSV